ncbi:hypothetical protein C8R44DRAFT_868338 [Mycena epipterygia]|nr:hypothetical protein C8R44DRAFT_868338 [Mycena epipterygia]
MTSPLRGRRRSETRRWITQEPEWDLASLAELSKETRPPACSRRREAALAVARRCLGQKPSALHRLTACTSPTISTAWARGYYRLEGEDGRAAHDYTAERFSAACESVLWCGSCRATRD